MLRRLSFVVILFKGETWNAVNMYQMVLSVLSTIPSPRCVREHCESSEFSLSHMENLHLCNAVFSVEKSEIWYCYQDKFRYSWMWMFLNDSSMRCNWFRSIVLHRPSCKARWKTRYRVTPQRALAIVRYCIIFNDIQEVDALASNSCTFLLCFPPSLSSLSLLSLSLSLSLSYGESSCIYTYIIEKLNKTKKS